MFRVLFAIKMFGHEIEIMSYSFFLLVGILSVIALGMMIAGKRGMPFKSTLACILLMGAGLIFGSRLLYAMNHLDIFMKSPALLFEAKFSKFSLYGGLILALATGIISCRIFKLSIWRLVDSLAPALGIGIASVRIGCFLNGCCFGKCSTVSWAVRFPFG
ncbi:MAG: prolipoprotein diacylglyceryl transferase, partial [Rubrobacteridae bacterium]|nr:prolipoprotein diacylglyceryl transferase [Rubrobacteridae bacterium]